MATPPLVGSGYDQMIGARQIPGQTQTEFYNKATGTGITSAADLLRYVQPYAGNQIVNEGNVFDVLSKGYTPQGTALGQIKNDLNQYQQDTFNQADTSNTRASSSLANQAASEQGNYNNYLKQYQDLSQKLQALQAPNYQDTYNQLYQQQGIPQLNSDYAANQKAIRELPYVNRMSMGNAGIATEGQLQADTTQKGIPLEIQQANLLDRLKLAQDFVNNSMNFKQLDANQSRQSLTDAINTVNQALQLSQSHFSTLNTLQQQQKDQQQKAAQFAFDNRITQPFYEIGGTIYRASDQKAYSSPEQFIADGGMHDFSNVQKLNKVSAPVEVNPGNTLVDPSTGKVLYQAPYTPSKYTSGEATSSGGSGGGSKSSGSSSKTTKYTSSSATSEIMGEWKKGYLQGNGTISSTDYKKAKQWWTSQGLSVSSFDKQFGYLIDKSSKNWKSDYGYGAS